MKIAVLSGKGGTGKTTISSNLATMLQNKTLIDCDVEEPNVHLFFEMPNQEKKTVYTEYPHVDMRKCDLCGKCEEFCHFNTIVAAKNRVLVFKETCHACGGCKIVCPKDAITYKKREIGIIHEGLSTNGIKIKYGVLNVGELTGVKVIEQLLEDIDKNEDVIIDSPPGTSCATVAAVESADYAIIVSEPTPFGVSDMKMVVEMLNNLNIPFGLIINKAGLGNDEIYQYATKESINIIGEIPFNREAAKTYSTGKLICEEISEIREQFNSIINNLNAILENKNGIRHE
jgi:MinD superfamily P-loop ATPase